MKRRALPTMMCVPPTAVFAGDGHVPQVRPVALYGAEVLRERCAPIGPDYPGLAVLVADMFATMEDAEGVGLAAPQIGLPIRLFVVDCSPWAEQLPELEGYRRVFINAEIYFRSEEQELREEGCLSLPGVAGAVPRSLTVRMRYLDERFVACDEEFTGIPAWVIQHEYDHLEGVVFSDRMTPEQQDRIENRLAELVREASPDSGK